MAKKRVSATKGFSSVVDGKSVIAVRVINILADNVRIVDKSTGKKLGFARKKEIDNGFDFTEAMRTEDLQGIVDHINSCNKHSYRMRYGKDPPGNYIDFQINSDYYEETMLMKCPKCGHTIPYREKDLPLRVICPRCKTEGVIR